MHFLLSNDDGYQATGLEQLAQALTALGDVTVVAPDRDRSGASNSLTLDSPLRAETADNGFVFVNGTPTDCVHLAITGLLEQEPDMVISGINAGANLGDDVLYSGTVAAAMEGRFLGRPAMALSLAGDNPGHYSTAVTVALALIGKIPELNSTSNLLLNVNVPDVPLQALNGYEMTRFGNRHKSQPAQKSLDPRGRPIYWVGPVGAEQDAGPGTDFHAVNHKRVSITPMQVDLTAHACLDNLNQWAKGLNDEF
ncbi:MAG: 5'/3'-nucleotidase SurE [Thiotrichales bacterium]|nr:5'/3'-nucleotidase SurE [Thiotrichales bacterium]